MLDKNKIKKLQKRGSGKMLYNLFTMYFIFIYFFIIIMSGISILLSIQFIVYQGSGKKINLYKKFMNNKFLWK